jgi:hypothetical protein
MMPPRRCIATSACLLLASLFLWAAAQAAAPVGTVTHLSGTLLARKADGTAKVLGQGSAVGEGDTLLSEPDSHARIRFTDGSDLTLKPDSRLRIDAPASFTLVKGGLRGSGRFTLDTPAGKLEVRGGIIAEHVPGTPEPAAYGPIRLAAMGAATKSDAPLLFAQAIPGGTTSRAPGLYVQVLDGIINLSNQGGSQNFSAGQFGFTPNFRQPPVVLPANPGMQFTPPPTFSSSTGTQGTMSGSGKSGNVDCEVR